MYAVKLYTFVDGSAPSQTERCWPKECMHKKKKKS